MDAFAASVAQGAKTKGARMREALRAACYFGSFEAITPVIGWALGTLLGSAMAHIDHWVAFGLLVSIGLKMIRDAWHAPTRQQPKNRPGFTRMTLLALSTSIDAAAVGVTLVVLQIPIVIAALVIGGTTFVMTCAGFMLGGVAGNRMPRYAEGLGGLLLIGIGIQTLLEHTILS